MSEWLPSPDSVRAIATLVGATAALWGVFVAQKGLSTWRKERDADLAKRLATAVFEHRELMKSIFRPYVTLKEWRHFEDENKALDADIYRYRWRQSHEAYEAVKPLLSEGDLRWKGEATSCYSAIVQLDEVFIEKISRLGLLEHRVFRGSSEQHQRALPEYERLTEELEDRGKERTTLNTKVDAAFEVITTLLKRKI